MQDCPYVYPADDFSGSYLSREYLLGAFIHILATVEQKDHQPLLLSVATATPELHSVGSVYLFAKEFLQFGFTAGCD